MSRPQPPFPTPPPKNHTSLTATLQNVCQNASVFCPEGSAAPMEASEGFYTVQAGSGGGDRQPSPGFAAMRTAQVRIGIGARELTVIDGRIHVPTRDDAVAGAAQAAPKALFGCPPPPHSSARVRASSCFHLTCRNGIPLIQSGLPPQAWVQVFL